MKSNQISLSRLGMLAATATFAILIGAVALPVQAAQDWDGDNNFGNFSYNNNWYGDVQPTWSSSANLNFHFNNGGANSLYNDYGGWVDTMNWYYVAGFPRSMTLTGVGNGVDIHARLENDCSYDQTISIPLSMKGDSGDDGNTVQINPVNAGLTLNGNLYNDNTKDLNVYGNNAKRLTLNTAWPQNNTGVKLIIQQNSIVNITAAQNYTGESDINAGELWLSTGGSLASGANIFVGNGGALSTTAKLWLTDAGHSLSKNLSVNNGNANTRFIGGLNTSGTVTYSGTIGLSGPVNLVADQTGGTVVFSGAISHVANISSVNVNGGASTAGGTVSVSGANTYSGNTTVSAGTLLVNNSSGSGTGSGTVGVSSTATLGGSGTISGAVTVSSGGTLAPGNPVGTLTLGGGLTLSSGALGTFDLSSTYNGSNDKIAITGNLTANNNALTINSAGTLDTSGNEYVLMTYSGTVSGSFNPTPAWSGTTPGNAANYSIYIDAGSKQVKLHYSSALPTASAVTLGVTENETATFPLAKYASDPAATALTPTFSSFNHGGSASYDSGTGLVTYTPASGFTGTETFNYYVTDAYGAKSAGAVVTANVAAVTGSGGNILSASYDSGTATIIFAGIPGATYTLQYTTSLTPPITWTAVGSNVTLPGIGQPNAGQATVTQSSAPSTAFYRTVYVSGP